MEDRIEIATLHFDALNDLSDKKSYEEIKDLLPSKEEFITHYPISTIGIVSTRKFWEECVECGIINHTFFDDSDFSEFEKNLHDLCEKHMYLYDEEYSTEQFKKDVMELFINNNHSI